MWHPAMLRPPIQRTRVVSRCPRMNSHQSDAPKTKSVDANRLTGEECRQAGASGELEGPKSDLLLSGPLRDRMRSLRRAVLLALVAGLATSVLAYQVGSRRLFGQEDSSSYYGSSGEPSEFYWSRLQYTSRAGGYGGGGFGFGYGYGGYGGSWSRDYPKADRQFLMALKRLTRIEARPTEQVVDLDHEDEPVPRQFPGKNIENYPWVYAVQVQNWTFTDAEAKRLRDYLLKGGFLMVDDFHGTADWERFMAGCAWFSPTVPVEDLQDKDEIFHVLYDLGDALSGARRAIRQYRAHVRERWLRSEMARDSGRQGPRHGRHLPQHASGRRLGMGGHARISGEVRFHGFSDRSRLHHVWNDALTGGLRPRWALAVRANV